MKLVITPAGRRLAHQQIAERILDPQTPNRVRLSGRHGAPSTSHMQ